MVRGPLLVALLISLPAFAEPPVLPPQQPGAVSASPSVSGSQNVIGRVALAEARDVKFSGAVSVDENAMAVGNGSVVTASNRTTHVKLARGGVVNVCSTTSVQMTQAVGSLMLSLDRGGLETHYQMQGHTTSDVVQTPDLRIAIEAPGDADVRIQVNGRGDTCVENHATEDAVVVSVTPQIGDGAYRVIAGQRALFEKGDVHEVVDHETYPCGCPPDEEPKPNEFPLAVSQGLAAPPAAMMGPVVPTGQVHAQVAATLVFDSQGAAPRDSDNSPEPVTVATKAPVVVPVPPRKASAKKPVKTAGDSAQGATVATAATTKKSKAPPVIATATTAAPPEKSNDVAHAVGRFFSRLFGKK